MFGAYNPRCRVGNWSEDLEAEEAKIREFLDKKAKGQLAIASFQAKMDHALQQVSISFANDGQLRFGDHVLVYSSQTTGLLSTDLSDNIVSDVTSYASTTSTLFKSPTARNAFIIEPVDGSANPVGSHLHFGDKFRLRSNPKLSPDQPLYLHSQAVSPLVSSKVSRNQLVCFSPKPTSATIWSLGHADPGQRFETVGDSVPANAEVVITHAMTRQNLSSDKIAYDNDYGTEFEVCAKTALSTSKTHVMNQEFRGQTTGDSSFRAQKPANNWALLTAQDPSQAQGLQQEQTSPEAGAPQEQQ